jgi:hypothetical protein
VRETGVPMIRMHDLRHTHAGLRSESIFAPWKRRN